MSFDAERDVFWETSFEEYPVGVRAKPPFDFAGPMGDGDRTISKAVISPSLARTGSKCVLIYQKAPPKTDAQRRVTCRLWNAAKLEEIYHSWWMYFPDKIAENQSGIWSNLGGLHMRYGPPGNRHAYSSGIAFFLRDDQPRNIYAKWRELFWGTDHYYYSNYFLSSEHVNRWIHLQVYQRLGIGDGIYRAWIEETLVADITGINNDPRGDPRWLSESCAFAYPHGTYVVNELYQPLTSPEAWLYVDDVVLSDKLVPSWYHPGTPISRIVGIQGPITTALIFGTLRVSI